MELNDIALIYVGDGKKLANIPARDLTLAEVNRCAGKLRLLKTGLYQEPKPPKRTYKRKSKAQED